MACSENKFISGDGVKRYVNIKEYSELGVDGFPAAANCADGELFYRSDLQQLERVVRELQEWDFRRSSGIRD